MECTVFGLPLTTVAIATGVPVAFAAFLIWWGIAYRPVENGEKRAGKGGK